MAGNRVMKNLKMTFCTVGEIFEEIKSVWILVDVERDRGLNWDSSRSLARPPLGCLTPDATMSLRVYVCMKGGIRDVYGAELVAQFFATTCLQVSIIASVFVERRISRLRLPYASVGRIPYLQLY